jgi:hypothetical protein
MAAALVTGLVNQQVSNEPGGDRWLRLIDESIDMFLAHCQSGRAEAATGRCRPRRLASALIERMFSRSRISRGSSSRGEQR